MSRQIKAKTKNLKPGQQPVYKSNQGICMTGITISKVTQQNM